MQNRLLYIAFFVLCVNIVRAQENSWNGIVPLKSKRTDVERLLGEGKKGLYYREFDYEKDSQKVTIIYAQKPCDMGWNVPKDTVISIASPPTKIENGKSAKELNLVEANYFVSADDAQYGTWTEPERGIQYRFINTSQNLLEVRYIPSRKDNATRCDGFPPYTPEAQYPAYDSTLFYNPNAGKDGGMEFLIQGAPLLNVLYSAKASEGKYIPYVVVYFDNALSFTDYKKRLARFKLLADRITTRMGFAKVRIIEGGMSEKNRAVFYVLPKEWKPPSLMPDLRSPQFTKRNRLVAEKLKPTKPGEKKRKHDR